jgi:hypothetical protein
MMGTTPRKYVSASIHHEHVRVVDTLPIVTRTEKSDVAIESMVLSMALSAAEWSFKVTNARG